MAVLPVLVNGQWMVRTHLLTCEHTDHYDDVTSLSLDVHRHYRLQLKEEFSNDGEETCIWCNFCLNKNSEMIETVLGTYKGVLTKVTDARARRYREFKIKDGMIPIL